MRRILHVWQPPPRLTYDRDVAKTAAIVQSNYIPWRGYFDLIDRVDVFVLYDCVQYTRRDWRNRNRIKTPRGPRWLSIPVVNRGRYHQSVEETEVASPEWAERHVAQIEASYSSAPGFPAHGDWLAATLREAARAKLLTEINELLLRRICGRLGIDPDKIARTSMFFPSEALMAQDRTARMVWLCQAVEAKTYLTGPSARAYLDEAQFADAGIAVEWMTYPDYPAYAQPWGAFEPQVSIVDLLLSVPDRHIDYIRPGRAV
jgi:WbqC-like protein